MVSPRSDSRSRSEKSPSLPEKVTFIHHALDGAKIPHAIGGALALAYYAEPRATIDVDINVFVTTERWPEICEALAPLGVDVEVEVDDLNRDGQVRLWWDRNPVDLFFSYDPFHDAMQRSARKVPFNQETIPILRPSTSRSARRCSTAPRIGSTSSRSWLPPIRWM